MENRLMNLDGSRPIMENWDELNEGFAKTEAELDAAAEVSEGIKAEVIAHKDSSAAHSAEHITYSGQVAGAGDMKAAVDSVKQQLDASVMAGDSGAAAAQAAIDVDGVDHKNLKVRLDKDFIGLSEQLADIANNRTSGLIAPGTGVEPADLQFDLVRICSDRLKMIENYNENFDVDISSNYPGIYEQIPSLQSGALTYESHNNMLELKNPVSTNTKIEDTNAGIIYSTSWGTVTGSQYSGGQERYSSMEGATIEYGFVGTGIRYFGDKQPDHGLADVYIDGSFAVNADGYSPTPQYQQLLAEVTGLPYGYHTVKIIITTNKNPASSNFIGTFDFFEIIDSEFDKNIWIKTPIKFLAPGFALRMTVEDDTVSGGVKSSALLGLIKDGNNWVMCNYNKTDGKINIIQYNAGAYSVVAEASAFEEIPPPYEVIMLVKNRYLTFIINKDNNVKGYVQTYLAGFDFKNPNVLRDFSLGVGAKIAKNQSLKISNIKSGYDQGVTFGADYKLITYEDGSPLKYLDSYYFTASEHSGQETGSGVLVYRVGLSSLQTELAGVIFSRVSDTDLHGDQTSKVMYDRNQKCFMFFANDFQNPALPQLRIGKTTANLLSGINIVPVQPLLIPSPSLPVWDADVIYNADEQKYKLVYTQDWVLKMSEATDVYGTWTLIKTSSARGEGAAFTRANGKWYVMFSPITHGSIMQVYDYDLNFVTLLNIDKFPSTNLSVGAFPWGFILPAQTDTETSFYLFLFSVRKWWDLQYAYGDLYIYKARQAEDGIEFKESNKLMF